MFFFSVKIILETETFMYLVINFFLQNCAYFQISIHIFHQNTLNINKSVIVKPIRTVNIYLLCEVHNNKLTHYTFQSR